MNIRELINLVEETEKDEEYSAEQAPEDNTVPFPGQDTKGPTGDPTLDQAPEGPGVMSKAKDWVKSKGGLGKVIGKGVGQLAKGVGAVAGGVAGAGRAIGKGFKAGADTVGGPGRVSGAPQNKAGTTAAGAAGQPAAAAGGKNVDSELTDLRGLINRLDARMTAAGIKENKKK